MRYSMTLLLFGVSVAAADLISDVRSAIAQNQMPIAQQMLDAYKKQRGTTPEMIEATSWVARAAVKQNKFDAAEHYVQDVMKMATGQLARQAGRLDAEPHLPVAIGAAIEVQGQALAGRGERGRDDRTFGQIPTDPVAAAGSHLRGEHERPRAPHPFTPGADRCGCRAAVLVC